MVKPLLVGAEFGSKAVRAAGKLPGVDVLLARAIVATSSVVPEAAEVQLTGESSGLRSFQERAATVLFSANAGGAEKLLKRLDIDSIDDPAYLERLAARYIKLRHYTAALKMRQRAAQLEPGSAQRWIALARSLERADYGAVVHDSVAGLAEGTRARVDEARAALETAEKLEPGNAYVLYQRGRLEFEYGDAATGLDLMEQAATQAPDAEKWLAVASSYRKPHIADYDRSLRAYERALELKPASASALRGIVIMGCRADQDWARLWRSVRLFEAQKRRRKVQRLALVDALAPLFSPEVTDAQIDDAVTRLNRAQDGGLRLSWIATSLIVYRLHFARRFRDGFRLREGLAERTLAWLGTRSAGNARHRQKVLAALLYLGRNEEALSLIEPMPWEPKDKLEKERLQKMAVDAHLLTGDLQPYLDYSAQRQREVPLPGDDRMRRMIEGKRVAVVGPADTGDRLGEIIDAHDVVIRPRYIPEILSAQADQLGRRTDIAYFSGRDLGEFFEAAREAVDSGDLQLAIGRGLSAELYRDNAPEWLRFYRHDYSLCHHGAPLGIARIIYDVLQFNPSEVSAFNVDFYTGANVFSSGYRRGKDAALGPYSIVNEILLAHDLLFDFRLMNAFIATGRVTPHGVSAQVLALDAEHYIDKLEASPALQ
ncbi:hypothetical protein [Nesterenkonia flava]|uniref:Tetratricopeptide repeat protein n=1 Tax=Nesterenkonia flava TaxID=469799 RepID=A0ABU1FQY5_9MICC|nr:hypothetical protein [Nesterenkonia flava]MDR5710762.1 hypothetical protein [Nesterenkonia flava]